MTPENLASDCQVFSYNRDGVPFNDRKSFDPAKTILDLNEKRLTWFHLLAAAAATLLTRNTLRPIHFVIVPI
jgi:hypothetical protein